MLIEFRLRNFRSFRDIAEVNFTASADKELERTHCILTGVSSTPRVTRTAAVFGANASGKSNLMFGLATMNLLVQHSTALSETQFAEFYTPFKLDPATVGGPTEFEVNVVISGVRYEYGFSHDAHRIRSEWLTVYRTAKGQRWFERRWDSDQGEEVWAGFSSHFSGPRETWRKATRPQALFLTTAAQFNSELLKPLFDWFTRDLVILNTPIVLGLGYTVQRLEEPAFKERVLEILRAADLHISDIRVEKRAGQQVAFSFELGKPAKVSAREQDIPDITFCHQVEGGEPVWFDSRYESAGTQRLLAYIGPILDAIENGKVLIIDEVDASLHPMVTRFLIGLLQDPVVSRRGAQLWVNTHDTSLLEGGLLRRDQVWFVDKDIKQASHLVPLTDFSPRKNEALERGYLRGRYGAVPFISSPRLQ